MFTDRDRDEAKKIRVIQECLNQSEIDVKGLRECAVSQFGFVNSALRRKIWPLLLGVDVKKIENHRPKIVNHKETDQVLKDVERSMWRFTKGNSQLRNQKKPELMNIVNAILSTNEDLHYFQGYHEVGSVLLLVTNERLAYAMLERLSLHHFRDCMFPTFSSVLSILNLLFPLIEYVDKTLYNFIKESEVQSLFAISWIITWFSHNMDELDDAARLFDFFLSSHPLASLYFSAVIIDHLKAGLLQLECSFDTVHSYFSNLPEHLPLDNLIKKTNDLLIKFPPSKLQSKSKIYLLKDSQMNLYPYDWMKTPIYNDNIKVLKGSVDSKKKKSLINQTTIYKYTFFIVFGSISIFSIFVYLSVYSPSTSNFIFSHIKQFIPSNILNLIRNKEFQ